MKTEIIPVGKEAIPVIQDLANKIWPPTFGEILSEVQIEYMLEMMYGTASLEEQMNREGLQFFMIRAESRLIGFMSLEDVGEEVRVHKLYILPEMQGKGLGRKMVESARNWAKERGARYLLLNVNKYNESAIGFYKSMHFKVRKEEDIDIGSGFWMNDYQMECRL